MLLQQTPPKQNNFLNEKDTIEQLLEDEEDAKSQQNQREIAEEEDNADVLSEGQMLITQVQEDNVAALPPT